MKLIFEDNNGKRFLLTPTDGSELPTAALDDVDALGLAVLQAMLIRTLATVANAGLVRYWDV